ncbi:hypothetical protein AAFF_G00325740 [Aldrovandia affinis]|uniref:Uncharacterized protein n=1 Tax=Aldrovandia affinis TaxID=143900 RepID=A0AAD7X0N1_9TELE|nr:hypothetical protein AAFF_G00325740 [Aldrovandia affinis]
MEMSRGAQSPGRRGQTLGLRILETGQLTRPQGEVTGSSRVSKPSCHQYYIGWEHRIGPRGDSLSPSSLRVPLTEGGNGSKPAAERRFKSAISSPRREAETSFPDLRRAKGSLDMRFRHYSPARASHVSAR